MQVFLLSRKNAGPVNSRAVARIYTKTGDKGETGLFGGRRVSKGHERIEAVGAVDEANAAIGLSFSMGIEGGAEIQNELFELGAHLAGAPAEISQSRIDRLEETIDDLQKDLEPLRNFILPGGDPAAAQLHVARCAVRRAERALTRLAELEDVDPKGLIYLNRLSDLLFVLARTVNKARGVSDVIWTKEEAE